MNQKAIAKKKKRAKSASMSPIKPGILRNASRQESFANHTISSAIKADYLKPEVKFKLNTLNSSVRKTKVVKQIPKLNFDYDQFSSDFRPFVVRKVEDSLILRKPELHDVLTDGLVLTKKNPKGQNKAQIRPRTPGSPGSVLSRNNSRSVSRSVSRSGSRSSSRSPSRSQSLNSSRSRSNNEYNCDNESAIFQTVSRGNGERNPILSRALNDKRKRLSRSTDLLPGHAHMLGKSMNQNLLRQNNRSSSASRNRSPGRFKAFDDLLPLAGDYELDGRYDTTLGRDLLLRFIFGLKIKNIINTKNRKL